MSAAPRRFSGRKRFIAFRGVRRFARSARRVTSCRTPSAFFRQRRGVRRALAANLPLAGSGRRTFRPTGVRAGESLFVAPYPSPFLPAVARRRSIRAWRQRPVPFGTHARPRCRPPWGGFRSGSIRERDAAARSDGFDAAHPAAVQPPSAALLPMTAIHAAAPDFLRVVRHAPLGGRRSGAFTFFGKRMFVVDCSCVHK